MGFVALRKRCPWSDHRKCAAYDRMSQATLVCCYGDGWIVIQADHKEMGVGEFAETAVADTPPPITGAALPDFPGNPNHWSVFTWFDGCIVRNDSFTSYRNATAYAVHAVHQLRASRPDRYGPKWVKANRHKVNLAPPNESNTFLMGNKRGGYSLIKHDRITKKFLKENT